MTTLFDIGSGKQPGNEHTLLLEAGPDFCSYAYLNKPAKTIDSLYYMTFDEWELDEQLPTLLRRLSANSFHQVIICSAFAQSLLVPNRFFQNDSLLLQSIYDLPAHTSFYDAIPEWQLTNVYALPQPLCNAAKDLFAAAQYYHAHTPSLKIYNGYMADNQLLINFTPQNFRVLLKKNAAVHLAQIYAYKTPLDVVYYLLKICTEFNLSQQDVFLILSGLIEKESSLFAELSQYFSNVHFAHPPEILLPGDDHPHYFFTSLYNLASCVS